MLTLTSTSRPRPLSVLPSGRESVMETRQLARPTLTAIVSPPNHSSNSWDVLHRQRCCLTITADSRAAPLRSASVMHEAINHEPYKCAKARAMHLGLQRVAASPTARDWLASACPHWIHLLSWPGRRGHRPASGCLRRPERPPGVKQVAASLRPRCCLACRSQAVESKGGFTVVARKGHDRL